MTKKLIICMGAWVLLSCAGNNDDQNETSVSTDDQCENGTNGTGTSMDEPSDRTEVEETDSLETTDEASTESEVETETGPLSDAAYEVLMLAGIFVDEGEIFTTSYNEGYNFNFEITEEQARSLLPDTMTPLALKLLESDEEPRYYLSWYMAVIDAAMAVTRIDLFTYAQTKSGDLSLFFVSSYMELPEIMKDNESMQAIFKEIFDFFGRDSRTGESAYPHYYSDSLSAEHDAFKLVYEDSWIEGTVCDPVSVNERFSRDFLMANSQIYRTEVDKNVNYFNQSFINAKVETRNLDCISSKNLTGFHPLLTNLKSVHFYGSKDKAITWYYQMCENEVCGNPFE